MSELSKFGGYRAENGDIINDEGVLLARTIDDVTAEKIVQYLKDREDMAMMLRRVSRYMPEGKQITSQLSDYIARKCPGNPLR